MGQEKEELQTALEEAEGALEQEENKVLRAALELSQVRQEIDRRVAEKEEEFASTRKNHARAMDSLGASLEAEQRSKADALRIKKKLEGEINELEIGLDHANKANNEGLKAIKRYQGQLKETIQAYEDQARLKQQITEQVGINERKAGALVGELEESRALLDGAERSKRQIDAEIDSTLMAAKNAEEKSKKAMMDASRLADELRAEQDHTTTQLGAKRSAEASLTELESKLANAEAAAMKGGKSALARLEQRVRELEAELGGLQGRTGEMMKGNQRAERKVKELQFAQDEDKKNQDRMSELANKLQAKIKTYKQQIEEAEEIAALNLAK